MAKNTIAPERLEAVSDYLRRNPTHGARRVSKALGIPKASAYRAIYVLERQQKIYRMKATKPTPVEEPRPEKGIRYDSQDNTAEAVIERPLTVDELLKKCRVDTARWVVDRFVCNKWEVGAKQDDGSVEVTPLYQIKVWLVKKPGLDESNMIRETLKWIEKNFRPAAVRTAKPAIRIDDEHLLEISVPDLHLGKLAWEQETGANYDSDIAESLFMQAVENLWLRSSVFPVTKILLVVGNDFYNVNSADNKTAAGTPQSEDGRWPRTFRRGIALTSRAIEYLRGRVRDGIEVRVIRGNHDSERVFMAGEVLRAMYAKTTDVTIVNEPAKRQYIRWGCVLLALTHGDGAKADKLPLIMAGEAPEFWAATTHREWHLGHFHHKRETQYHTGAEHGPVRVRVLPSLTAADEWHYAQGYVGAQRAAEAYLWSKKRGYVGHLSWGPS